MRWKISIAQIFWFSNSNATTFPKSRKSKNFNFSLYTVPAEMLYLQKYLTNFQKLFLVKWRGRWLLWLKTSSSQIFWFCNSNAKTFPTFRKCKNFNFSLYTVPAEMLCLQKYLTNLQKLFFGLNTRKVAMVVENSSARIFWFWYSNVTTFPTSRKCKIFNFSPYTVPAEMLYLQKHLTNLQKLFLGWMKRKVAIVVGNFKSIDIFFAIATLQLFQHPLNVKISIFPFTLSRQKYYISRSI